MTLPISQTCVKNDEETYIISHIRYKLGECLLTKEILLAKTISLYISCSNFYVSWTYCFDRESFSCRVFLPKRLFTSANTQQTICHTKCSLTPWRAVARFSLLSSTELVMEWRWPCSDSLMQSLPAIGYEANIVLVISSCKLGSGPMGKLLIMR